MLIEAVKVKLGYKNLLAELAGGRDFWMNLPEVRYRRAVHHRPCRAPGMVVLRRVRVVVLRVVLKRAQQGFEVAFQIEERKRTCRLMHARHDSIPGRAQANALRLQ